MHHSGTYNNQFIVVDLKLFKPGKELQPGLLHILELLPGACCAAATPPMLPDDRKMTHWNEASSSSSSCTCA